MFNTILIRRKVEIGNVYVLCKINFIRIKILGI